jgi:class 3 adenylate cyclase/tetratricopeptide (TPR) repeat protein
VAGFTAVAEQLLSKGQSGAEELSEHLNRVFGPMVDSVLDGNGFVAGYAGDALTAVFPPEAFEEAAESARNVVEQLRTRDGIETSTGTFSLAASAALDTGTVFWSVVEQNGASAWFYLGDVVRSCASLLESGRPGELTISGSSNTALRRPDVFDGLPREVPESTDRLLRSDHLVDLPMWGEFRPVASVFIRAEVTDDRMPDLLRRVLGLAAGYGGYFNAVEGKAEWPLISVLFGAPRSSEDDLARAVEFSLEVRDSLDAPVALGLTHGTVYAGSIGSERRCTYSVLGHQVNLAARLCATAEVGALLVPESLANDLEPDYISAQRGSHALKGLADLVRVFGIQGRSGRTLLGGEQVPLIGRNPERKVLVDHCRRTTSGASPSVLYVYGDAGTGKTRLVSELESFLGSGFCIVSLPGERVGAQRSSRADWLTGLLPRLMGQRDLDGSADPTGWMKETLFDAGVSAESSAGAIEHLSAMERELEVLLGRTTMAEYALGALDAGVLERLASAVAAFLQALSGGSPTVLVLENLDSMEPDKRMIFEMVADRLGEAPVAIIVTSRPMDDGTMPVLDLQTPLPTGRIVLANLNREETAVLVEELVGLRPGESMVRFVFDRAAGNPLFTEQLCAYLSESDLLSSDDTEEAVEVSAAGRAAPGSISGVMVARLDRLPTRIKLLAGRASVLAQPFDARVLSRMWKSDDFPALLSEGSRLMLWRAMGDQRYRFVHPMLRDTANRMQLPGSKRRLHRLAAQAMIETLGEKGPHLPELARHLELAGDVDSARRYLRKAAAAAVSQWRNREAAELFGTLMPTVPKGSEDWFAFAFDRMEALHRSGSWDSMAKLAEEMLGLAEGPLPRSRACLWLGKALKAKGSSARAGEVLKEGIDLAQDAGDLRLEIMLLSEYGDCLAYLGETDRERPVRERQLKLAQDLSDPRLLMGSEVSMGYMLLAAGEYGPALERFGSALSKTEVLDDPASLQRVLSGLGNSCWLKGDLEGAESYYIRAMGIAEKIGDRRGVGAAATNLGNVSLARGLFSKALECYRKRLRLAGELGDRRGIANALGNEGSVLYKMSRPADAKECFQRMLSISEELSYPKGESIALGNLATLALEDGDCEAALDLAQRKLSICKRTGDQAGKAFALGRLGSISKYMGRFDRAEERLSERLAILKRLQNDRKRAWCLFEYSVVQQMRGRMEEAISACERGLQLATGMKREELYCMLQNQLSRLLLESGRVDEARDLSQEAVVLAEGLNSDKLLRDTMETTARLTALKRPLKALAILEDLMEGSDDPADRANCLYWTCKIRPDPGAAAEALKLYRKLEAETGWRFFKDRIIELESMREDRL